MYALGEVQDLPAQPHDPLVKEIGEIMALRQKVMEGSDLGYLPPLARLLIEREIPRLIGLLANRGFQPRTASIGRR